MSGMTKVSKVSVALTAEMTALVHQAVASGEYASGSEVIREALREWKHRRAQKFQQQEELARVWAEGVASGPGRFDSIDDVKQEARRLQGAGSAPPEST